MFGKNEIVGAKYFDDAPNNSLMVTSLFYTIQGEGPLMGTPAIFIRLSKCNLACSFCDAFFDQGEYMTFDDILDLSESRIHDFYAERNIPTPEWATGGMWGVNLVVTGGEPALQDKLTDFLQYCDDQKYFGKLQIESNGIRHIGVPDSLVYVVSPKCTEKRVDGEIRPVKYLTPNKKVLERADCMKFVVESDPESLYNGVPDWADAWLKEKPGREIYVSPMNIYKTLPKKAKELRESGRNSTDIDTRSTTDEVVDFWSGLEDGFLDAKANEENHKHAAKLCMEKGYRLNLQMHLYAGLA